MRRGAEEIVAKNPLDDFQSKPSLGRFQLEIESPSVRYDTIRLLGMTHFELVKVEWPSERAAALSLRAALRGEPQAVPEAPWAEVLAFADADGEHGGEVAWLPGKPAEWWLAPGSLPILGADEIARAGYFERPVTIVESPEAWLEARQESKFEFACCILDWQVRLDSWLFGPPALVAATPEIARFLDAKLTGYRPGRLLVRGPRNGRAAA